jgi:hypothetical protein
VVWSAQRRLLTVGTGVGVVVVVFVALFLLRSTDDTGNSKAVQDVNTLPPTTFASSSSSTTSTTVNPGRPPAQVRVQVVNSSGATGAATTKSNELKGLGYVVVGVANGASRTGIAVQCKSGFEKEAVALARNVAAGTTVEPFPTPAPAGSADADCLVVLGK